MRYYTKILVWENEKRLKKLIEFRKLVIKYFNNSPPGLMGQRIEKKDAQEARTEINMDKTEVHSIILNSGTNLTYTYHPPPAVGGRVMDIDLIFNIFDLDQLHVDSKMVLDYIEIAIGKYQSNHKPALVRIFNPFFYIGLGIDATISNLLFIVIGTLGFNRQKAETSTIGRLFKGFIQIVVWAIFILQAFERFEPVKQFVHKLLDYGKAN